MNTPGQRVLVIVPAFNEAASIQGVIDQVRGAAPECDILVVDDGSADATAEQALARSVHVVRLPFNLGIGGAVQTGFQYALAGGYDVAVQIDGDGQHDASFLPVLLGPIQAGEADMAVGSRFIGASAGFKSSAGRRAGIYVLVRLINALTGLRITDPTSGFRAHNRRLIAAFARYYPHDFPEPEAVVLASRMKARVVEVPVVMRARQGGNSSITHLKSLYYMVKVTFAIMLHMIRRPLQGTAHLQ